MFKKKKFLRIIAVSVAVLGQVGIQNAVWGMNENSINDSLYSDSYHVRNHVLWVEHSRKFDNFNYNQNGIHPPSDWVKVAPTNFPNCFTYAACKECWEYRQNNGKEPSTCNVWLAHKKHWTLETDTRQAGLGVVTYSEKEIFFTPVVPQVTAVSGCSLCASAYKEYSQNLIDAYKLKQAQEYQLLVKDKVDKKFLERQEFLEEKNFLNERILSVQKENNLLKITFEKDTNELKQHFSLFQQKHEESQKELKLVITSLQEENKSLKKLFTTLPSTNECELFNMGEEKFLNETSLPEKNRMLYQGALSLNKIINTIKQKANELGQEDKDIISLSTQIISEDQVPEYCMPLLLKKDSSIFLPWSSTKTVFEAMLNEVSLEKNALPSHILVEDEESKEGGILLSSYIKKELEQGLDAKISIEGKNRFKNMVSSIEKIQGNFWKDNEGISTVPVLLKKLNGGDNDQEWVLGWSNLEEDYKKYVSATVLYKMSKRSLPKKYEDIESYLMDK